MEDYLRLIVRVFIYKDKNFFKLLILEYPVYIDIFVIEQEGPYKSLKVL